MSLHLVPGVLVEALGSSWVSYSPASGQTHVLNDESAAVLEVLGLHDGFSPAQVCAVLAADSGASVEQIEQTMGAAWRLLVDSGLIRTSCRAGTAPAS